MAERIKVSFSGAFQSAVGGAKSLEFEAASIRDLMTQLSTQYPKLASHLDDGVAVSINGEIYRDNWNIPIKPGSEVFLIPRIPGG